MPSKLTMCIFVLIFAVAIFGIHFFALANPLPPGYEPPSFREVLHSNLRVFLIDIVFDGIILLIAYRILRKNVFDKPGKLLMYISLVAIGGFFLDWIVLFPEMMMPDLKMGLFGIPFYFCVFIVMFIVLFVFNFLLSRLYYKLKNKEAIILGLMMGILTNPLIFITPYYYSDNSSAYTTVGKFLFYKILHLY